MTDWRTAMRDAAQREEQDCLTGDQAEAMRRVVLAAVADEAGGRARVVWMRRPVLVAAMIVAIVSTVWERGIHLDLSTRSEQMSVSGQRPGRLNSSRRTALARRRQIVNSSF